ncbi:endolytic transglycosylase MltG [Croceicoccus sp. F390]|uniref:Endolytic murein transglycosylase n=1 Tax=Croceicoccus esteveae TaxID=3075597 RepID=A0ABU2ZLS3_9SPHN|nr:endolytic transglycosylase MltG [Croceicoccus sp. F390]MDT0577161.1 endolytic transglycosylase MltG [Croceicoccus sp. F390]
MEERRRLRRWLAGGAAAIGLLLVVTAAIFAWGWYAKSPSEQDRAFVVRSGSSLSAVAGALEQDGIIGSRDGFVLRAKLFGSSAPVKAGEFLIPAGASPADIFGILQSGDVIRRFVTIPEGLPSILVHERLMAEPLLTGPVAVPAEGTILPDSYDFERGEPRAAVMARMQSAMTEFLGSAWPQRAASSAVANLAEAVTLASVVEKETGIPSERRMVAGLYSNRLKAGMRLQADPTIIYPLTKGKPLGRRILRSEIDAVNDFNTYSMAGLPKGPITNPGRASILAVLNPAPTEARYMVADGTGGHVFAETLAEHNANVRQWRRLRRQRGEM